MVFFLLELITFLCYNLFWWHIFNTHQETHIAPLERPLCFIKSFIKSALEGVICVSQWVLKMCHQNKVYHKRDKLKSNQNHAFQCCNCYFICLMRSCFPIQYKNLKLNIVFFLEFVKQSCAFCSHCILESLFWLRFYFVCILMAHEYHI